MKRAGIDIDGVIANTQPVIIERLNDHFGRNYVLEDFINFNPAKMFGIDRRQLDIFIMERELEIIQAALPRDGAMKALARLKEEYEIYLISARSPAHLQNTVAWLNNFNIPFDDIVHLGHHDKRESCTSQGVNFFVEDNKQNAIQISSCGIPVFLYDATYNQGELPDLVYRVYSWPEITRRIKKEL